MTETQAVVNPCSELEAGEKMTCEIHDDGLPSKLICVQYTLAMCGCDPRDAESLVDDMLKKRKAFDDYIKEIRIKEAFFGM